VSDAEQTDEKLPLDNAQLAARLEETADLLEDQEANPFRVQAYRTGAERLRALDVPARDVVRVHGRTGLMRIPGIGKGLARTIEEMVLAGTMGLLEQLRGAAGAEAVLGTVPGVGPQLAARIHDRLGVETLEELERAAHDGRLALVPGMGPRRVRAVRDSLAGRFRRRGRVEAPPADEPPVGELLDVDQEYRDKVGAGVLRRIAPRRFNPSGEAWLPILHTSRGERQYTVMFSNSARAHDLGRERDWVIVYRDDDGGGGQWTVVTAQSGRLRGRRIVAGRERESAAHHGVPLKPGAATPSSPPAPVG
jgi:DNA polymerase (family 10)